MKYLSLQQAMLGMRVTLLLIPETDKDQYSILWVEHQVKGRLELNFLVSSHWIR